MPTGSGQRQNAQHMAIQKSAQPLDRPGQGDGSESRFSIGLERDPFTIPGAEAPEAAPLRFCKKTASKD
jgi:hypothetical protein